MASRRDELNAYTYAKKRMVSAFLQPTASGTEEGAPNPLRTVMPSLIVGALILAGFGAWGLFKPVAPKGWAEPGTNVIIGSDSTTRYVVLETNDKVQLHPVLNLASAKLVLDPGKGNVVKVDEKVLDDGKLPHGPTIGIPYAPDRLPDAAEAGRAKRWAICEQPGGQGTTVQKAAFVFAGREQSKTEGSRRLRGGQVLYVKDQKQVRYLVDAKGTKYRIGQADSGPAPDYTTDGNKLLLQALLGSEQPQNVTDDWLDTLREGKPIVFPSIPGVGSDAHVDGLSQRANHVGMVLQAQTGAGPQQYVVLSGKVAPVSDFTGALILGSGEAKKLHQNGEPQGVDLGTVVPVRAEETFYGDRGWPRQKTDLVNSAAGTAARDTVCSVLRGASGGHTTLSTWAGQDFPATVAEGGSTTYVTPGTGLLYRQTKSGQPDLGSLFLVTDTGLRYAVQSNNDGDAGTSGIGENGKGGKDDDQSSSQSGEQMGEAGIRLGYRDVDPALVPVEWSQFLSKGPRLSQTSARQPQGS